MDVKITGFNTDDEAHAFVMFLRKSMENMLIGCRTDKYTFYPDWEYSSQDDNGYILGISTNPSKN